MKKILFLLNYNTKIYNNKFKLYNKHKSKNKNKEYLLRLILNNRLVQHLQKHIKLSNKKEIKF